MPKERIPSPGGMNLLARLISRIKSGLGIVEETNTATHTIAAGKYVTWKGNVYRAKSAIPSGTALSSSNLETLSDGGLNDLSGLLNSKFAWITGNSTTDKTASIGVPNTANEAIVRVQIRSQIYINYYFNKIELSRQSESFYDAGSAFSTSAYGCRLKLQNYYFSIDSIHVGAGTEDFKMELFYR